MIFNKQGEHASDIEVTNVSSHGFWLQMGGKEYFLAFEDFPWFKDASISEISHVKKQGQNNLYWPDLDVDLSLAIIEHPENFPLVSKS